MGVSRTDAAAKKWERKAASRALAEALVLFAMMYVAGDLVAATGVPKNYAEAVKWCRKAAEQGHVEAQYWLEDLEAK